MNVIFAGPTISHPEVLRHLDCVCLPPVSHRDILRILPEKPDAIGIIDGYFEGKASVWHKEILYAMDQGVRVYGSSSMGALRAAELHAFGMRGVGQVFEWYRDEVILDDDEVAVLHGPEEVGFVVASEPMVNIRATLALAHQHQVIDSHQHSILLNIAKRTFYKKRRWSALLEACTDLLKDAARAQSTINWLQENRIDLKKQDAVSLLELMRQDQAGNSAQADIQQHFEWTQVWDLAFQESQSARVSSRPLSNDDRMVLDQLRLDPIQYERYQEKSLLSWMSVNRIEAGVSDSATKAALKQFRARNQLASRSQLMDYMGRAGLDESTLTDLLHGVSRMEMIRNAAGDLQAGIIDHLKLDGLYLDMLDVANQKKTALNSAEALSEGIGMLPPQVIAWYFVDRLGAAVPPRLEDHVARIGLESTEDFYQLILSEYKYAGRGE